MCQFWVIFFMIQNRGIFVFSLNVNPTRLHFFRTVITFLWLLLLKPFPLGSIKHFTKVALHSKSLYLHLKQHWVESDNYSNVALLLLLLKHGTNISVCITRCWHRWTISPLYTYSFNISLTHNLPGGANPDGWTAWLRECTSCACRIRTPVWYRDQSLWFRRG